MSGLVERAMVALLAYRDELKASRDELSEPVARKLAEVIDIYATLATEVDRLQEVEEQLDAIREVADSYRLIEDTQILENHAP